MIYLIPTELYEGEVKPIPPYVLDAIKECQVFFVENERTARRFLKRLWREMVINDYGWVTIHKAEGDVLQQFEQAIKEGKNIGIMSEAGCPGVADPGQLLVARAQVLGTVIKPLVGPSSILLALMASGLNGQSFTFNGYLPIEEPARKKAILRIEEDARRNGTTHLFIETPYRNDAMMKTLVETCRPDTLICVAANLTATEGENISTLPVKKWKQNGLPVLHKKPVIFLIGAAL